jgi:adenylosuccinate synthase
MTVAVVVGAQWGDEGKGKIVDLLSEEANMVVRYGGGANAGHTLVKDGKQLVTHLVPSGVLHPGTRCVLGDGMVIDPDVLVKEIGECRDLGLLANGELLVGEGAHLVMPYHRLVEGLREDRSARVGKSIGTTRRGIGPTYESKCARRGVRVMDLYDRKRMEDLFEQNLSELGAIVQHYGGELPSKETVSSWIDDAMRAGESIQQSVGDAGMSVHQAIEAGENVLFEGAQGALLDLDHGTYPYVTSSSTLAGGAPQGVGIGPTKIDKVIGITKAYCTRVGEGPFPTEMLGAEEESWRQAGGEFGATTGRPRRCGWLDVASLRRVVRTNGLASLALTKLDILSGRGTIKVCVGYRVRGEVVSELPRREADCGEPVYEELEGWQEDISGARSLDDMPAKAQEFVAQLEAMTGVPICIVSVGPDRKQTIILREQF